MQKHILAGVLSLLVLAKTGIAEEPRKASVTDLLEPDVDRTDEERDAVLRVVDRETDRLDAL